MIKRMWLTNTLQDHVHRNGQVNELDGLVKRSSYSGEGWEVYASCQRATTTPSFIAQGDQFNNFT